MSTIEIQFVHKNNVSDSGNFFFNLQRKQLVGNLIKNVKYLRIFFSEYKEI